MEERLSNGATLIDRQNGVVLAYWIKGGKKEYITWLEVEHPGQEPYYIQGNYFYGDDIEGARADFEGRVARERRIDRGRGTVANIRRRNRRAARRNYQFKGLHNRRPSALAYDFDDYLISILYDDLLEALAKRLGEQKDTITEELILDTFENMLHVENQLAMHFVSSNVGNILEGFRMRYA